MNPDNCGHSTKGPKVLPLTESVGLHDGPINLAISGRLTIASAPAEHAPTGGAVKPDGGSVCPRVEDFED